MRCSLFPDGSTRDWICLEGPARYLLMTADLLWSVENAKVTLIQGELSGTFDLASTKDEKLRECASKNAGFPRTPLPEQPLDRRKCSARSDHP